MKEPQKSALAEVVRLAVERASKQITTENFDRMVKDFANGGSEIAHLVRQKCDSLIPSKTEQPAQYAYCKAAMTALIDDLNEVEQYSGVSSWMYEESIAEILEEDPEFELLAESWQEMSPYGYWVFAEEKIYNYQTEEGYKVEQYLVCDKERISVELAEVMVRDFLLSNIDYWIRKLCNRVYFNTTIDEWCEAYEEALDDEGRKEEIESRLKRQLF